MQYLTFKTGMMSDPANHPEDYARGITTWAELTKHADDVYSDLMLLMHNVQMVDGMIAELMEAAEGPFLTIDAGHVGPFFPPTQSPIDHAFSIKASMYSLLQRVGEIRNQAARRSVAE